MPMQKYSLFPDIATIDELYITPLVLDVVVPNIGPGTPVALLVQQLGTCAQYPVVNVHTGVVALVQDAKHPPI